MGGEKQGDGPRAGFNRYWKDGHDINRMWSVVNMEHNPRPKAPEYFVNVGDVGKGPFSLPYAKKISDGVLLAGPLQAEPFSK